MKNVISICILFFFTFSALADQLAYISKTDAEKAASLIRKTDKLFLFCGCCDNETPSILFVKSVEVKYTGYENYYEVIVTAIANENAESTTVALDLAYVWVKEKKKYYTLGDKLNLEHDKCKAYPLKSKKPKKVKAKKPDKPIEDSTHYSEMLKRREESTLEH